MIRVRLENDGSSDDIYTPHYYYIVNRHERSKSLLRRNSSSESVELLDHSIVQTASVDKSYKAGVFKKARVIIKNPSAKCFSLLNLDVKKLSLSSILARQSGGDERQSFIDEFRFPIIDIYDDDIEIDSDLYVTGNSGAAGFDGRTYIIDAISRNDLFISNITTGKIKSRFTTSASGKVTIEAAYKELKKRYNDIDLRPPNKYPDGLLKDEKGVPIEKRVNIVPTQTLQQNLNDIDVAFGTLTTLTKSSSINQNAENLGLDLDVGVDSRGRTIVSVKKEVYRLDVRIAGNIVEEGDRDAGTFSYSLGTLHASPHVEDYSKMVFTTIFNPRAKIFSNIKISLPPNLYEDSFRAFSPTPVKPNTSLDSFLRRGEVEIKGTIVEYTHTLSPTERKTEVKAVVSLGDKAIPVRAILERLGAGGAIIGR